MDDVEPRARTLSVDAGAPPAAQGGRPRHLMHPRTAWVYLGATSALSIVYGAGALDEWVYTLMLVATFLCVVVGVRRNQPARTWHWWMFSVATILWGAAAVVRESVQSVGVLTSDRSLLPDLVALPAYALVALALFGLLRARVAGTSDRNAWLDAAVVCLGALLLGFVLALGPTLSDPTAWLPAQLAVAIYPPLSAVLVAIACRLVFGSVRSSPSHKLVFAGMCFLLVGDIVFAMAEIGRLSAGRLFELPYLLSSAAFGAAVLHPSMRHFTQPTSRRHGRLTTSRVGVLGVALLLPAFVAVFVPATTPAARWFLGVNLLALALAATARLLFTVREQAQSEARLAHQATHDDLTGLPNRTLALEFIEERLMANEQSGGRLAVMFADVDRFKLINDSLGHGVGDELLVAAARRLAGALREQDLVARMSGDEFLVVCDQVDEVEALALAERVRASFAEGFDLSAGRMHATASVGVVLSEAHALDRGQTLVRDADTAMYESKVGGRNAITLFDVEMGQRVERRVSLELRLRAALEHGEIVPYFQPIVDLPDGRIEGFEALARWPHAIDVVGPVDFIPVAEESGLIVALGASVLDQACAQLAAWRRDDPAARDAYVSVNVSARQVADSDIVGTVAKTLARWRLPGSALLLEITESVMMADTVESRAILNALCALGVRLSVDDFGTGYSSLSYLKRYPVSSVKIDKSFIDGLDEVGADDSLVVAIIAMANALGLRTIAEGVEREAQATRLFELGCTGAQGYHFARPAPAEDVPSLVALLGWSSDVAACA